MSSQCPYAKSEMTPCVKKDGNIAFAIDWKDDPICVGCERSPKTLEVPFPNDWKQTVDDYYLKNPSAKRHYR